VWSAPVPALAQVEALRAVLQTGERAERSELPQPGRPFEVVGTGPKRPSVFAELGADLAPEVLRC
jgi:hypothetical protein